MSDDVLGPGHWRVGVSPYTYHYHQDDAHRPVWALSLERQHSSDGLLGASYFRNSFGQPCLYLYGGMRFPALLGQPSLFGQVSGGLLYGYVGEYQHKVPLNYGGYSPGALVSLGWQFNKQASAMVHMLGNAGLMIQFSTDLR